MRPPPWWLLLLLLPALPVLAGIAHHYSLRLKRLVQRLRLSFPRTTESSP